MWNDLTMQQRADVIAMAVKAGMRDMNSIRSFYDKTVGSGRRFDDGGELSDTQYQAIMRRVAEENWRNWKAESPEAAYQMAINDPTYDYRGYYNKYPNSRANASTHWTDEFKTVYHPTFSDESIYSGKVHPKYNPHGLTGGHWLNDIYIPPKYQSTFKFAEGGDTSYDDKLIDFVIQEEGFLEEPEDIGDGKQTLGSGLTAKKWHDLYRQRGNKWSEEDNRMAVAEELSNRRRWAEKNVPNWDTLPEDSKNAMLSYKYNYDFNAANSPNMYAALRNRDWEEAARQMDATSKDPKFKKGLADRRAREQMLFLEGFINSPLGPVLPKTFADQQEIIEPVNIRPLLQTPKRIDPRLAPIMVPDKDKYVSIHRITQEDADREEEQKVVDKIKAIDRFNKMMDRLSVENTATPAFVPYNPYVVNGNADGGSIYIKPSHRGRLTELKAKEGGALSNINKSHIYDGTTEGNQKMVDGITGDFSGERRYFKYTGRRPKKP